MKMFPATFIHGFDSGDLMNGYNKGGDIMVDFGFR